MTVEGGRPQDQGRRHSRKGAPSPETVALLGAYQAAMRAELRAILDTVGAIKVGLLGDAPPELALPLDDVRRDRLWDRAVKLGRELGTAIDVDPPPIEPAAPGSRRTRGRVDYG